MNIYIYIYTHIYMACSRSLLFTWGVAPNVVGSASLGPSWAPLGRHGPGPNGPPGPSWAGPLRAQLGPCGPGPCGPPWALMGRALVGPPGPSWAGSNGPPWVFMGRALMPPLWASDATPREKASPQPFLFPFEYANKKLPYVYV